MRLLSGSIKNNPAHQDSSLLRRRVATLGSMMLSRTMEMRHSLAAQIHFSKYVLDFGRHSGDFLRLCNAFESVKDVIHIRNGSKYDATFTLLDEHKKKDGVLLKVKPTSGTISSGSQSKLLFKLTILSTSNVQVNRRESISEKLKFSDSPSLK
jgi:hypothetical protein